MASKSVLNCENLAALGAERLADLLMEVATGDAATKRRLRLELAAAESPRKLANDIRKRLAALGVAKNNIGWRTVKTLIAELTALQRLIAKPLGEAEPAEGLDLMWAFLDLADSLLERASDTSGNLLAVFQQARADIPALVATARPASDTLADALGQAVLANGYGQADGLITATAPFLGEDGLRRLQKLIVDNSGKAEKTMSLRTRRTAKWRRGRRLERDLVARRPRADMIHRALLDIADAQGDVDAYIALQARRGDATTAGQVARRLLDAGRYAEALGMLEDTKPRGHPAPSLLALKAEALEKLGRADEAQLCRLSGYHQTLDADLLRQYLKRLPDFDDIEAEDAALDFARQSPDADAALGFLLRWPSLERAASLVLERSTQIASDDDDLLLMGATRLGPRHPLAAIVLLRKLINAILMQSRSRDYARAAEYLSDAEHLAAQLDDFAGFEPHKAYVVKLHANFRHRQDFWDLAA